VKGLQLEVEEIVSTPRIVARLLTSEQKELGALVIDMAAARRITSFNSDGVIKHTAFSRSAATTFQRSRTA